MTVNLKQKLFTYLIFLLNMNIFVVQFYGMAGNTSLEQNK